jgi:hypothetical protein
MTAAEAEAMRTPHINLLRLTVSTLLLVGCSIGDGTETGEEPRCTDPLYGNGVCDLQTSCGAPDIDCFATFETQDQAQQWYVQHQAPDRPALAASDSRFSRIQALVDDAWEAYKSVHEVGDLASKKMHAVLIDLPGFNAFAKGDGKLAGFLIMVNRGVLDSGVTDEAIQSVIMHEFQHAIGLHVIPAVRAAFPRYYVAPTGSEPLGFQQSDDPVTRGLMEKWISDATLGGYLNEAALGGLPYGELLDVFKAALTKAATTSTCTTARSKAAALYDAVSKGADVLDGSVTLPSTFTSTLVSSVMTEVGTACLSALTLDAIDAYSQVMRVTRDVARQKVPAAALTSVEAKPLTTGLTAWNKALRDRLRATEAEFTTKKGLPWSRARYYTTEEAADDASVVSMIAMGGRGDVGVASLLATDPRLPAACTPLLDSNSPVPYGKNLAEIHHATCFRAYHVKAVASSGAKPPARLQQLIAPGPLAVIDERTYSH